MEVGLVESQIFGTFLFTLFLIVGYFTSGRPQYILLSSLISVALGLLTGELNYRFTKKHLREGVFHTDAYSTTFQIVSLGVWLLLLSLISVSPYQATLNWMLILACISHLVYMTFAISFLQRKMGHILYGASSKRDLLWGVLFVIGYWVVQLVFGIRLTGNPS